MQLDKWELLAPFIGLSEGDCIAIKEENDSRYELRPLAMMKKWKKLNGSKATYLMLALGLEEIQRFDLVEDLCRLRVCHESGAVKKGKGMKCTKI